MSGADYALFGTPGSDELADAVIARRQALNLARAVPNDDPNKFFTVMEKTPDAVIAQLCAFVRGLVLIMAESEGASPEDVMHAVA